MSTLGTNYMSTLGTNKIGGLDFFTIKTIKNAEWSQMTQKTRVYFYHFFSYALELFCITMFYCEFELFQGSPRHQSQD
jgi:hypothetical protein